MGDGPLLAPSGAVEGDIALYTRFGPAAQRFGCTAVAAPTGGVPLQSAKNLDDA
jgi:hypothetical protein